MCFSVNELPYLCKKNNIDKIFYVDDVWQQKAINTPINLTKLENTF